MQALPDRVTVLVDDALRFEDVDVAKAREELAQAAERQKAEGCDPRPTLASRRSSTSPARSCA